LYDDNLELAFGHVNRNSVGSASSSFYQKYNELWPLPEGWQLRETIYNLYHILNHYVLFGGSYKNQADSMIARILQ
jgi:fructosamine-3-kinase